MKHESVSFMRMNLKLLILALFLKYQLIFEINSFLLEYKKSYVKNRYVLVFENIYIVLILNLALGRIGTRMKTWSVIISTLRNIMRFLL